MASLQERIERIMASATARGGTVKVSVPLADLRALAKEAEDLRKAIDLADGVPHGPAQEIIRKARANSILYDDGD